MCGLVCVVGLMTLAMKYLIVDRAEEQMLQDARVPCGMTAPGVVSSAWWTAGWQCRDGSVNRAYVLRDNTDPNLSCSACCTEETEVESNETVLVCRFEATRHKVANGR
jgi:hypothetical protein